MVHAFTPRENGRYPNSCVLCGKVPEAHAPPHPQRDHDYELQFIERAIEQALRLTGITNPGFSARIRRRMAEGEEIYGNAWATRENLPEVLDESPDIPGYSLLELQRLRHNGIDLDLFEDVEHDLLAASSYACVSDWYAQRAARRLAGGDD